jgi:hypothetical protein
MSLRSRGLAVALLGSIVLASGAAMGASSPTSTAASANVSASGQWMLDSGSDPATYELTLRLTRGHGHESWGSRSVSLDRLVGLSADIVRDGAPSASFEVRRDAGTIRARGSFADGKGGGTFDLVLDPAFASELERRGVGRPTEAQQIELALADASLAFLDDLKSFGYPTPDVALFVRCVEHGVDRKFVRGLKDLGYSLASIDDLIEARDHGVDPAFIRGMQAAGYRHPEFEELLRARDHGADADFAQGLQRAGYRAVPLDQLIEARPEWTATCQDLKTPGTGLTDGGRAAGSRRRRSLRQARSRRWARVSSPR